ncbi:hypothetical protein JOD54_000178 [Actinokineospora baliensis]|uniref:hypothetical protein n=1 Tax=Actinokineospora baliensis TaxID=547056 RepID=UPI00195AC83E|nr:hypothetical protein [Actinokineospora baliensis]MBM7769974.1 hypothetical protein [Actinokineospora baliensis]
MRVFPLVLAALLGAVVGIGASPVCALPHRSTPAEHVRADQESLVRGLVFSAVEHHHDLADDATPGTGAHPPAAVAAAWGPGLPVPSGEPATARLLARGPPRGR